VGNQGQCRRGAEAIRNVAWLAQGTEQAAAIDEWIGMHVFTCPWKDPRADAFAEQQDAVLAVGRLEAARLDGAILPSLSPAGLLEATPVPRLVLPSPNGSAITSVPRDSGSAVAIGCLRNPRVASTWAAEQRLVA
jgi:2-phosphosulfolactate phosphatase